MRTLIQPPPPSCPAPCVDGDGTHVRCAGGGEWKYVKERGGWITISECRDANPVHRRAAVRDEEKSGEIGEERSALPVRASLPLAPLISIEPTEDEQRRRQAAKLNVIDPINLPAFPPSLFNIEPDTTMKPTLNQARDNIRLVNKWNAEHAVSTPVIVNSHDGKPLRTFTSTEAYLMGGHTAVVMLQGLSAPVELSKVRADLPTVPDAA